eukprot:TRINITY_DN10452_c0_g1_i1.p1 TRINITY_DN10452_c0_g1~~TRINITY_DN10452_c0_g1_i1.p1  ORF type:complete len:454 (-),score=63.73 TRINITY_DN10452_c0_g1_i1:45-1406(-)
MKGGTKGLSGPGDGLWVSIFILVLLVASAHGDSPPQEPRFCSLPVDAQNFTCNFIQYAKSLNDRTLPATIVTAAILVIVTILIILPCCFEVGCCKVDKAERSFARRVYVVLFAIIFTIFLVGIACGIYANLNTNDKIKDVNRNLNDLSQETTQTIANITTNLHSSPYAPQYAHTIDQLTAAQKDISTGVTTITSNSDNTILYKDIFTYVTVSLLVIFSVIFFFYLMTGSRVLFHVTGLFSWFVLLGVCLFVVSTTLSSVIVTDLCQEVHTSPGGLLQLIQQDAENTYELVTKELVHTKNNLTSALCKQVEDSCTSNNGARFLCPCNSSNIRELQYKSVDDGGDLKTVPECAQTCSDTGLKKLSQSIMDSISLEATLTSILEDLQHLFAIFTGPSAKALLDKAICHTESLFVTLWAGCVFIFIGLLLTQFLLLGIEKPFWCFKQDIETDAYQLQ